MILDTQETIVALSSALGGGARAVIRVSGPTSLHVIAKHFDPSPRAPIRGRFPGHVTLPGISPAPADLFIWPAPNSYTGQEVVEIHTVAAPPLLELLMTHLLDSGARQAEPGEFTLRAFLSGKLDLTRVEAVLGVIEAEERDDLKRALDQLAGGVTRPVELLRADLLDLLADVEAGLDFAEEDIEFVDPSAMLHRLAKALALVTLLGKQLDDRGVAGRAFRAVFVGRPNVGKSSLFNALAGAAALVSPEPGTTRDYLVGGFELDGVSVELVDTAGIREEAGTLEQRAQALGHGEAERSDLTLICVEAGHPMLPHEAEWLHQPKVLGVTTKCDRAAPHPGLLATSVLTGEGLERLRAALVEKAKNRPATPLAPCLSRCRHHVGDCLRHLRKAHEHAREGDPPELLAVELRGALETLGAIAGEVYTDELLDRIFSRFCIGK